MSDEIIVEINQIKQIFEGQSSDVQIFEAVVQLRKMTSKELNPPLAPIVESNVCKHLFRFLDNTVNASLIFECLWILTNVVSGNSFQTQYIIDLQGISQFLKYVAHESEDIMAQALWALGNIAGENVHYRDLVLKEDAVTIVLKQLERKSLKIENQRTIVWVISNFCRGKPQPSYQIIRPCMFYLGKAIENFQQDQEIVVDSLWGLCYLSEMTGSVNDLIAYGILQNICKHYIHSLNNSILTPALRVIGNVATLEDQYVDYLMELNVHERLISLFLNEKKSNVKESLWTMSNITAGNEAQVLKVLELPHFYDNLIANVNQTLDIQKELFFVIANSLNHSHSCKFFLERNIINQFFDKMTLNDAKIQRVLIEGLSLLIEYCIKNKINIPDLQEKVLFMKNKIYSKLNETNKTDFRIVHQKFIQLFRSQTTLDSLSNELNNLSLQGNQEYLEEFYKQYGIGDSDDEQNMDEEDSEDIDQENETENNNNQNVIELEEGNQQQYVNINGSAAAAPPIVENYYFYQQQYTGASAAPGP